ncbi:MAG: 16S rRNA (cytosine(967)-C(5))-methyltransferase RsmB [Fimbriimonadaceae bacterium]|nr:16S rRNA (cytosine(967)-C(5))-methyltransferase RsmB [Fimbriimonadaceae bacterium]
MSATSRAVAVAVQRAVETGAFAEVALHRELTTASLQGPSAARATALTHGSIRLRRRCDFVLRPLLSRPLGGLDPVLRAVLRVGAFELLWAAQTRVGAAVNDLVNIARDWGHAGLAQYANGVFRRLAGEADALRDEPPELAADPVERLVEWESHPRWLVQRWVARHGVETARAWCLAGNREPRLHLRANRLRTSAADLLHVLRNRGIAVEAGRLCPEAVLLQEPQAVEGLPGWREGWFTIQDEGAMLIAPVSGATAGQRVIDLCAAPGGKATHLAELLGDQGEVLACDRNAGRLQRVDQAAARLGLKCIQTVAGDVRETLTAAAPAEVVLLDAPCSGSGTLARRPDLRWHLKAARLAEVTALQCELLAAAARLTRPGGVLVYATCSMEQEENEGQMRWFDSTFGDFAPAAAGPVPPSWDAAAGWATIGPGDGHDGFFVACRRRSR